MIEKVLLIVMVLVFSMPAHSQSLLDNADGIAVENIKTHVNVLGRCCNISFDLKNTYQPAGNETINRLHMANLSNIVCLAIDKDGGVATRWCPGDYRGLLVPGANLTIYFNNYFESGIVEVIIVNLRNGQIIADIPATLRMVPGCALESSIRIYV